MLSQYAKVPKVFKTDEKGLAIPEMVPGSEWAVQDSSALMTIKLDGMLIKVDWDQSKSAFRLTRVRPNGSMIYQLMPNVADDKDIIAAFDRQSTRATGNFLAYGQGVHGNPHRLKGTYLIRISPVHHELIVKPESTIVRRGISVTTQEFYDAVRAELMMSPEIPGFVFHKEGHKMETEKTAVVTREDFGLPWPAPLSLA